MPKGTASAPDEVAELLKTAIAKGHLVILRTASPHGDAQTQLHVVLNQLFGLTPTESRMLAALREHGFVSREALHAATARDGNPVSNIKTMDVMISTMRAKLRPYGAEITTVHGHGFKLTASARDKIERMLAEHDSGIKAPAEPASVSPD